jgi:hypothetical protein
MVNKLEIKTQETRKKNNVCFIDKQRQRRRRKGVNLGCSKMQNNLDLG